MALASCLCPNSRRDMVVKIFYPGGRVEIYDRPIRAAQIMQRNPRCCVTFPNVFREPSAIITPDTVLMLGQKFYVVPKSTLRKLQRLSARSPNYSPHLTSRNTSTPKRYFYCLKSFANKNTRGEDKFDDGCLNFFPEIPKKTQQGKAAIYGIRTRENATKELRSPKQVRKNSPHATPSYHWQPSLDSITEE